MFTVKFRRLHPNAKLPEYKTKGSAGMDLFAAETGILKPGETWVVRTSLAIELPPGYEAQVRSRSGLASKGIVVANSPGTIDSDYQGEIGVVLHNHSENSHFVGVGDRIAQLVIAPAPQVTIAESYEAPAATERGAGGFGSTGK